MSKTSIIIIIIVMLAIFGIIWLAEKNPDQASGGQLDQFAQCLASKNITMYGAVWCSHCQNEKKAFGDSFKYVPYVECPDNPNFCTEKGITAFPTWIFGDGRKFVGEQGIQKLSEESGCLLPAQQD